MDSHALTATPPRAQMAFKGFFLTLSPFRGRYDVNLSGLIQKRNRIKFVDS